jgi:hypothetical protein
MGPTLFSSVSCPQHVALSPKEKRPADWLASTLRSVRNSSKRQRQLGRSFHPSSSLYILEGKTASQSDYVQFGLF